MKLPRSLSPVVLVAVLVLSLVAAWVAWSTRGRLPAGLERDSASAVHGGLQLRVCSVSHQLGSMHLHYVFEWVGRSTFHFRRPFGEIDVYFLDAHGREAGEPVAQGYCLPYRFLCGRCSQGPRGLDNPNRFEAAAVVQPPPGAHYISLGLGPDLMTKPVPIPW